MTQLFRNTFATTTTSAIRLIAAMALVATLTVALAACGGGDDDTATSPPAPAATATSSDGLATALPDDTTNDTTQMTPSVGSERLFILALDFDSVSLNLEAGQNVNLSYSSIGATTGGPGNQSGEGVVAAESRLTIVDPLEDQIITTERLEENALEFTAEITGMYNLVFENPYKLQALDLTVEWEIS